MASLEEVHARIRAKKKERSEISRMFKDELASEPRYQEIIDKMKALRDEKKSIENAAYTRAAKDAEKLDLLKLDIKSDQEMLSDIAITMYTEGKTVEVVDEYNTRWVPSFSVRFSKDTENVEAHAPAVAMTEEKSKGELATAQAGASGSELGMPKFNPNDY